jgi:N-acetylmuramoyl-L-alanine amidase
MLNRVRSVDRGVKYARYYVLRYSKNPAILVEGGFVSNSRERGRTKEGWYREAIANGIVDGIVDYKRRGSRASW